MGGEGGGVLEGGKRVRGGGMREEEIEVRSREGTIDSCSLLQ